MKRNTVKRICSLIMTLVAVMSLLPAAALAASSGDVTAITLYPANASLQSGRVDGFRGEVFADQGVAVEVWAYSDEKTNAILVSGDLPDVMYVRKENLDVMIEAGMLLNLDEHLDKMPNITGNKDVMTAINYVKSFVSAGTGSAYCLPLVVGTPNLEVPETLRNPLKLNWAVYEEIGAPPIGSYDDLVDVMEQMMKAHPVGADGTPMWGTVLNSGGDTTYWACMQLWFRQQGYTEYQLPYLLETNAVKGDYNSILSKESLYYKGLQWYNEVYKRGLMDPDSINNERSTQKAKVDQGYAMVPSGTLPGWNPNYYEYLIPGTQLYNENWLQPYGDSTYVIAVNANTENLDACLKFLNALADPMVYCQITAGKDGAGAWYSEGDVALLTDAYFEALSKPGQSEFTLNNGEKPILWNTQWIISDYEEIPLKSPTGKNRQVAPVKWEEVLDALAANDNMNKWRKTMGYDSWNDLILDKQAVTIVSPLENVNSFTTKPDDVMQLTIDAIRDKVVNASWKMVYASTDEEFESIWEQMVSDCEKLGCQQIIDWRLQDLENAKAVRDSLSE